MKKLLSLFLLMILLQGCKNRDINEGEEFRPRVIKDTFEGTYFTKVTVDGVEYILTERDNNNPHEGFGFMALRGNTMIEKQDTLILYLKTLQYFQNKIYSRMHEITADSGQAEFIAKFDEFLFLQNKELDELQNEKMEISK